MTIIVFGGPSIHGVAPDELRCLDIRPPAACGDLLAAALEGPAQIALIDGIFENAQSVWHKEILFALAEGIVVSGAASMGALRAAECAAFGMVGVGAIFEDYRSGRRTADSDVAVTHAPAELGFRPLTVALADVEAMLAVMQGNGAVSAAENAALQTAAEALHFSRRRWAAMLKLAAFPATRTAEIMATVRSMDHSQKREDARALLATLHEGRLPRPPRTIKAARLARTPFLERLKGAIIARTGKAPRGQ